METESQVRWARFKKYFREYPEIGLSLDISRMHFDDGFLESMAPRFDRAFREMDELEAGAIANPDEKRMVGHYWLRAPELAPTREIGDEISKTQKDILAFASKVHAGEIRGANGPFRRMILIGIGGSALGPQFVSDALGDPKKDRLSISFLDNTDPDGFDRVLSAAGDLGCALCLVVSKSGGTKETRNGMVETMHRYEAQGIRFSQHAVAVTGNGSELDQLACREDWLMRFPMWDWVGGRTSQTSAVGLVPAALQGFDIASLLDGARFCDRLTRNKDLLLNPAALIAAMWFAAGNGHGTRDMVVLPYKDRLVLFSRYLQQLVMESLGKQLDVDGSRVNQGIAVYGNKGSTDQHAYIQQLRDGLDNFFVTFIEVLKDRDTCSMEVEESVRSGDYLSGFLHGTREALSGNSRQSMTITLESVTPVSIGALIAVFERAVGFYASMIRINAYHQPGVESGKKAAIRYLEVQSAVLSAILVGRDKRQSVEEIAHSAGRTDDIEAVFRICRHLGSNETVKTDLPIAKSTLESRYWTE